MDVSTSSSAKPIEFLVLDAGALIRGHGLSLYKTAKRIITVPDVIAEIRDSKARELLDKLPFEIEERIPCQSSINIVAQFAKKTGDYAAISKTDLRLIALTHMLELELNGKKYENDLAGKLDFTTLSDQVKAAAAKAARGGSEETSARPPAVSSEPVPAPKIPLPPARLWATKSWATVLSGNSSTATSNDTAALETSSEDPVSVPHADTVEQEDSDDSEESSESEEESESESESEGEQEGHGEESSAGVDHFAVDASSALAASGTDIAGVLAAVAEETAAEEEWDPKQSLVTGFDENCGCAHADPAAPHSHAEHSAPHAATKTAASVVKESNSEGVHSRLMRPSGFASTSYASAAESTKMRLEDDGVGWVNNTNLLQNKGRNGYALNAHGPRKVKAAPAASADGSDSVSNVASELNSVSISAADSSVQKKRKAKKRPTKVACLTTDFAMQNVMLQMSLRVMSVDGLLIKSARQWVLRCMGCFEVHYDMDRLFCRKCGGSHLSRVAASVDSGGELRLHLKKNYHVELRGTKYSLPAPGKQGRYQGEILLREDQLLAGIWKQKCVKIRKDIKSAFGEDVTSDVGMHINKGQAIKIGMGKQNRNAAKGRERRGKSKGTAPK